MTVSLTRAGRLIAPPGVFRVLLAAIVVVNHSVPIHLGSAAVYLFFMLSGFWVHEMWAREYVHCHRPYATFMISRLWRLLPVYYVSLILFLLLDRIFGTAHTVLPRAEFWTGLHFYVAQLGILSYAPLPATQKFIPPVWSLDIELQFYIVAPLLLGWLARGRTAAFRRMLAYGVAALGFAWFIAYDGGIHAQSACLPMYLVFFLIGLHTAGTGRAPSPALAAGGLGVAALLVGACIAVPATRPLLVEGSFSGWLSNYNPDANIVLALLAAPYAMATVRNPPPQGTRYATVDRHLGNITYEIYLLHWDVLLVAGHFVGNLSKYRQLPALAAAWICLGPVCWVVYHLIDRPIDRARRRFVRSRLLEEKNFFFEKKKQKTFAPWFHRPIRIPPQA